MEQEEFNSERQMPREQIIGHVSCSYLSDANLSDFEGVVVDLSSSGLGMFIHKPVAEGAELKISARGLWDNHRYATVKWCRKIDSDIYRVGLAFK